MREIEFRLWCKNKNEWESDRFAIKPNGVVFDLVHMIPYSEKTHILQQFTGLLDKNGVKIFEGDRVTWTEYWNEEFETHYGTVEYNNNTCQFYPTHMINNRYWEKVEVIGNIFEKDMLK